MDSSKPKEVVAEQEEEPLVGAVPEVKECKRDHLEVRLTLTFSVDQMVQYIPKSWRHVIASKTVSTAHSPCVPGVATTKFAKVTPLEMTEATLWRFQSSMTKVIKADAEIH